MKKLNHMMRLETEVSEKKLDDISGGHGKVWIPKIEAHTDSKVIGLDKPEIVYTAAPLCLWSYANEPIVDELFERIRTEQLGIKITILTGVNWWGPSDPVYAKHNRKNWDKYRQDSMDVPPSKRQPLNEAVWDSDMTHNSAIQASIAVLTAGIQDEPGKYDIYWTVTRHISRGVFRDVRDPAIRTELLAMTSEAQRELKERGIKFDLEQFAYQYDTGVGARILETHQRINEIVVQDAYAEYRELLQKTGEKMGFEPGPRFPLIYARKSPRNHFKESFPIIGTVMESMVERAVEETTRAEKRKLNVKKFLAGGQDNVDLDLVTTRQLLAGTRKRTRYYHVDPKIALPKDPYFPRRLTLPGRENIDPTKKITIPGQYSPKPNTVLQISK